MMEKKRLLKLEKDVKTLKDEISELRITVHYLANNVELKT
jgi:hypothetical protein